MTPEAPIPASLATESGNASELSNPASNVLVEPRDTIHGPPRRSLLARLDRRIVRSVIYTTATAILFLLFKGSEWLLEHTLAAGKGYSLPLALVIALGLALVFQLFHRRLEQAVARWLHRATHARLNALEELCREIALIRDPGRLQKRVVERLDHVLQITGSAIYVTKSNDVFVLAAATGRYPPDVFADDPAIINIKLHRKETIPSSHGSHLLPQMIWPILVGERLVGFLGIGKRDHRESVNDTEIKAIAAVADAVGHSLALLDGGLIVQRSHDAIVAPVTRVDTPTNLPQQLTPLIGRRNELGQIRRLLGDGRLVTLKGTGGIGKTRLAIQTGYHLVEEFSGGVWFVDLAVVRDPDVVGSAALIAVRQPPQQNQTALETLTEYLRDRMALIIFDNCEQVVESVAKMCNTLLQASPRLRILCTSREALSINGEHLFSVPSLAEQEAILLFVARAKAVSDNFSDTAANRGDIGKIVQRLDGISLAIELAAARMRGMTLSELSNRLDDLFHVLTGVNRGALPRQQTLHAMIAWSHDLLNDAEKQLFRRLAVFNGKFSLEAVSMIASDANLEGWQVLDILLHLVDKSLVQSELSSAEQRYRLFDSTRAFAYEQLVNQGEQETLHARHLEYYANQAEGARAAYETSNWIEYREWLRGNYSNVRAALEWSLAEAQDPSRGACMAAVLAEFWIEYAQFSEAGHWLGLAARQFSNLTPLEQARQLCGRGNLAERCGQYVDADALLSQGVTIVEKLADAERDLANIYNYLGVVKYRRNMYDDALRFMERAFATYRAQGRHKREGFALSNFGGVQVCLGNKAKAAPMLDEALTIVRETKGDQIEPFTLSWLAECAYENGGGDTAISTVGHAIDLRRAHGASPVLAQSLGRRSKYLLAAGNVPAARADLTEALQIFVERPHSSFLADFCDDCARFALATHRAAIAAELIGFGEQWSAENKIMRHPIYQQHAGELIRQIQHELGAENYAACYAKGKALKLPQALALAHTMLDTVVAEPTGRAKA